MNFWIARVSASSAAARRVTFPDQSKDAKLWLSAEDALAENTDLPNNVGPVAQAFGTTTEVFYLDPLDYYFNNFVGHPIFTGISQLYYRAGGALNGGGDTPAVAFGPAGEEVVTAATTDRVVILGDSNVFSNGTFDTADNRAFARNVFEWLCSGSPTPARTSTWGRVKSMYR